MFKKNNTPRKASSATGIDWRGLRGPSDGRADWVPGCCEVATIALPASVLSLKLVDELPGLSAARNGGARSRDAQQGATAHIIFPRKMTLSC
jgi:hypothetical protein